MCSVHEEEVEKERGRGGEIGRGGEGEVDFTIS